MGGLPGDRYLLPENSFDDWLGRDGQIAVWDNGAWQYYEPNQGWLCWDESEQLLLSYSASEWSPLIGNDGKFNALGVNTDADSTNRLAVKSDTILFTHDDITPGNQSMRMVMNKASNTDTTSLLFQSNYEGRGEIGFGSDDNLNVKVSDDGANWSDALRINKQTANVELPSDTSRFSINENNPQHTFQINKSEIEKTSAAFAMTGWGRTSPAPADEHGVGLYLNFNFPGNRQFSLCDTQSGNGLRVIGTNIDAITNFSNRADLNIGTSSNGAHVGSPIPNTQFSVSNHSGTVSKTVFEISGAGSQTADLFKITKTHGGSSGDALSVDADGNMKLGNTVSLVVLTLATLPTDPDTGAMVFCTDITGGAQPLYYDGTDWKKITDGTLAV